MYFCARQFFFVSLVIITIPCFVYAQNDTVVVSAGNGTTPGLNTTTEEEEQEAFTFPPLVTLSDEVFDEIANVDFGRFTPMDQAFNYFNMQNYYKKHRFNEWVDRCYKQYMRCVIAQVYPYPVCAITYENYYSRVYYKASFPSYCDVHLQNCRTARWMFTIAYENFCTGGRFDWDHDARRVLNSLSKILSFN